MARRERKGRVKREREKEWMNSKANTVETRRGLNICFADGRQPTTAKKRNVHTKWILLHIYIYMLEKKKDSWYILSITLSSISNWRERKNKLIFFYPLVRDENHSINHSGSLDTMGRISLTEMYGTELDLRYWPLSIIRIQRERKKEIECWLSEYFSPVYASAHTLMIFYASSFYTAK